MFGSYKDKNFLYILLEYLPNGTLFDFCTRKFLKENEIGFIFKQITEAVNYFHSKNFLHRDIKPENILIDKDFNFKLCDFGFAAPFSLKRGTVCGTSEYLSPEIIKNEIQDEKVDIWCLGILLYEMTHKKVPFRGLSFAQRQTLSSQFNIKPYLNKDLKWIIKSCLRKSNEDRPTAEEILENSFMKQIDLNRNVFDLKQKKIEIKKKRSIIFDDDGENKIDYEMNHNIFTNGNEGLKLRKTLVANNNLRSSIIVNLENNKNDSNFAKNNFNNESTKQSLTFNNNNINLINTLNSSKNSVVVKNQNKLNNSKNFINNNKIVSKNINIILKNSFNNNFQKAINKKIVYSKSQDIRLIKEKESSFAMNFNKFDYLNNSDNVKIMKNNNFIKRKENNLKPNQILSKNNSKRIIFLNKNSKNFRKKNFKSQTPNKIKLYKNSQNKFQYSKNMNSLKPENFYTFDQKKILKSNSNFETFNKNEKMINFANVIKEEKIIRFDKDVNDKKGRKYRKTVVINKLLNFQNMKNIYSLNESEKNIFEKEKKIDTLDNLSYEEKLEKEVNFKINHQKVKKAKRYRKTKAIPVSKQILEEEEKKKKDVFFQNQNPKINMGKRYRKTKAIPVSKQILEEEKQKMVKFNENQKSTNKRKYRKTNFARNFSNEPKKIFVRNFSNEPKIFTKKFGIENVKQIFDDKNYINEKKVLFLDNRNNDVVGRKYKKTKAVFPSKLLLMENKNFY